MTIDGIMGSLHIPTLVFCCADPSCMMKQLLPYQTADDPVDKESADSSLADCCSKVPI
jgi:hypothetical protein